MFFAAATQTSVDFEPEINHMCLFICPYQVKRIMKNDLESN